jgi:alkylation response protein AidB-like acyl-CoA dehydrogenase
VLPPRRWKMRWPTHSSGRASAEFDVERYFRDAPLMIVGEGTNEIQRNVIAAQLVARGGI